MNIYVKTVLQALGYAILLYPLAYIYLSIESAAYPESIVWLEALIVTVSSCFIAALTFNYSEIKEYRKKKAEEKNRKEQDTKNNDDNTSDSDLTNQ